MAERRREKQRERERKKQIRERNLILVENAKLTSFRHASVQVCF